MDSKERKVISKIINDDEKTLSDQLVKAEKAFVYYKLKEKSFGKRACLYALLASILIGLGTSYDGRNRTFLFIVAVVGAVTIASSIVNIWNFILCHGGLLVCKKCYPQTKQFLDLAIKNKIIEVSYEYGFGAVVTITVEDPSGRLLSFDMKCVRKIDAEVKEVTLDVEKMVVIVPKRNAKKERRYM